MHDPYFNKLVQTLLFIIPNIYFYNKIEFKIKGGGSVHFEKFYYKNLYFVVWLKYF